MQRENFLGLRVNQNPSNPKKPGNPKNPSRLPGIFAIRLHRCAAGAILFTEPMRKEVANAMNDAELDSLMGRGASV